MAIKSLVTFGRSEINAVMPDILVSTPSKLLPHVSCASGAPKLDLKQTLQFLIVDEADLVLGFGYEKEVNEIFGLVSATCQYVLCSATMAEGVAEMRDMMLRNPVTYLM